VIETLCGLSDGLAVRWFRVFTIIPMVRLRWERLLDPESRRRRAFFAPASLSLLSLPLLLLLQLSLAFSRDAGFGSPTARAALEHVPMVQEPIQHGGNSGAIAEQLSPVVYWPI
jgi:hypothetical protein